MSDVLLKWIGGAGFIIKTDKLTIGIDLYLSNACMDDKGAFKRLAPPLIKPDELDLDYLLSSHEHGDHLDPGSINSLISKGNSTRLICPADTKKGAERLGVDKSRIVELNRGDALDLGDFSVRAVPADHGDQSRDAVGFFLSICGKCIYFTGDTCFRTDFEEYIGLKEEIDVLLVPINGKYGNPDARDAAYFVQMLKPKLTIPCHFWLFAEHGGDPGDFIECCNRIAPESKTAVLCIGEKIIL